jgi:hypothetical protein
MTSVISDESLMFAVYFAPRGKLRLLSLGHHLGQRHLSPLDKLIGVIGAAGAGKSLLIKGMFPGLELTNDDTGINIRPLPLVAHYEEGSFAYHTYHVDVRFEMAFAPLQQLVAAIHEAIVQKRRVVVEHFEAIFPYLKINAEILFGIGEEVIVTRPNIFGPLPEDIARIVFKSLRYRRMAHTAEDLTGFILLSEGFYEGPLSHDDVKHGFVLEFKEKPSFDPKVVERRVKEYIDHGMEIAYCDEEHIMIGQYKLVCTGPRIHLRNSSEVENFQLIKEFMYDYFCGMYMLVGLVGTDRPINLNDINDLTF